MPTRRSRVRAPLPAPTVMNDLLKKKCVPCEGGVKPFDISEIHKYQKKVDGWDVSKNHKDIYCLEKKFAFKNFFDFFCINLFNLINLIYLK